MDEDQDAQPDNASVDWGQIRKFLRHEVTKEVRYAVQPITSKLESHDSRLAVVEASVKSIQEGVNAGRWETANIAGMLSGFIGTKDVTGKFDIAIDAIKATADRANVLSHATRDTLQSLSERLYKFEGSLEGEEKLGIKHEGWIRWAVAAIASSGAGAWLLKHFRH